MKDKKVPVIKFRPMSIEDNINFVKDDNLSKEEKEKIIEDVVRVEYEKGRDNILKDVERYNNLWKDYNDKYFNVLCDYFGVYFPNDLDVIDASVGLIPVFLDI